MSGAGRRVGAEFEFDFDANVHRSNPLKVRGRSRRWAIGIARQAQNFKLRAHSSTYPVYGARLLYASFEGSLLTVDASEIDSSLPTAGVLSFERS